MEKPCEDYNIEDLKAKIVFFILGIFSKNWKYRLTFDTEIRIFTFYN